MRESVVQHAQIFALLLVVFTYVPRLGHGTNPEGSTTTTTTNPATTKDIYFPGSSWVLPYCVVTLFVLSRQSRRLRHALQSLQQALLRSSAAAKASTTMHKVCSSDALKGISRVSSREALSRISSSDAIRRLGSSIRKSLTCYKRRRTLQAITAKECFARLDYIEQLSIRDIAVIFRYAKLVNRANFDKKQFQKEQNKLIRAMVTAIDMAVVVSRGAASVLPKRTTRVAEPLSPSGEMDALYFVAAVRIFVEWRALRLVPPGFKRYSLSMNMARGDMMQNLTKIEAAVHAYLEFYTTSSHSNTLNDASDESPLPSPTLRQLLEYEAKYIHKSLPRLEGKTAAVGFLWIQRQIHYQESTLHNSIQVPSLQFQTPQEAALAAYQEVYADYHGWAVQQIFKNSFGGTPPLEVLWTQMDPPVRLLKDEHETTTTSINPSVSKPKYSFILPDPSRLMRDESLDDSEDDNSLMLEEENEIELALGELRNDIAGAWEGTVQFFSRFLCVVLPSEDGRRSSDDLLISRESYLALANLEETALAHQLEETMCPPPPPPHQEHTSSAPSMDSVERVKHDVQLHVAEMNPLVEDWHALIVELNMNDSSKV